MLRVKAIALRCAVGLLALFFVAISAHAQDVRVNCYTPACTITPTGGVPWGSGNLTFIFTPLSPRVSIYLYLHNNNPSNGHTTQTISFFQTPFGAGIAPSLSANADRWVQDAVQQNASAGASCSNVNAANPSSPGASGLGSCMVMATFASQVAIKISGAASQSGSPDTFDLAIVQVAENSMSGSSGSPGGQSLSSANSGSASPAPIQVISDALHSAFTINATLTTPGSNENLATITAGSGKSLYFNTVTISSEDSSPILLYVVLVAAPGSSCSAAQIENMNPSFNSAVGSTATANYNCSTLPTAEGLIFPLMVPANGTVQVSLQGIVGAAGSGAGVEVLNTSSSIGAAVFVSLTWYEK